MLWAITPEGRTANLGEVLLNGTKSKLDVTTELQVFGLIVTAEPYYAVSQPSDLVVMENIVRADTVGKVEADRRQVRTAAARPVSTSGQSPGAENRPETTHRVVRGAQRGANRTLHGRR